MLSKRTINQIIKNNNEDSSETKYSKSLKYLEKNNIPYEEAIGVIIENNNTIRGLPLYLIRENKINNYLYMYKSVSINLLIEAYKSNIKDIEIPKEYLLNNIDYKFLLNTIEVINDKDILLNLFNSNKDVFTYPIKCVFDVYEDEYNNFISLLQNFYRNKGDKKYSELLNLFLFDIEWEKKDIEKILYEVNGDRISSSLIENIVSSYDFDLFKKIVDKYGFDYEKSVPNEYSYYYTPIIPNLFLIDDRFDYNSKNPNQTNKIERIQQFLDLFIELDLPLFPKEMMKQTRSGDVEMQKMFSKEKSCVGTISRGYYKTSKQIKDMIDDNNNDKIKIKVIDLIKYYLSNSNSLEIDNAFWKITLNSNKELNQILLNFNKTTNKKWTKEEIRSTLKSAIYGNKPHLIHDLLKDNKENLNFLHIKENGKTILINILQESDRDIENEKLLELIKNLLDYGYRINHHLWKEPFYNLFIFERLNMKENLIKLCKDYPNNYENFISFEIERVYSLNDSFKNVIDTTNQVLIILKELGFENINKIYFDKIDKDFAYYYAPSLNKTIYFNINLFSGNKIEKKDFIFYDNLSCF